MARLIEITGKALSGEWGTDDVVGNGIPVLRTTNFTNEGVVNYDNVVTRNITKKNIAEKYLRQGDIIIEKSGGSDKQPVGRVIYFDGPDNTYLFNNFTGLLRVKDPNTWLPKYVFYSLFANYRRGGTRYFENKTTGLHNLKTDDYVSRYIVNDAGYTEQVKICEHLDKLRGIIQLRREELERLDELIKARFVEMFANEKNYPRCPIGSVLVQNSNVEKVVDMKNERYITVALYGKGARERIIKDSKYPVPFSGYRVKAGQFIYSRIDARNAAFAIIPDYLEGATVSKDFPVFDIRTDAIQPQFLMQSVLDDNFVAQVKRSSFGATNRQRISEAAFLKYTIPIPSMNLQKSFAAFVKQVDKSKVAVQKALDEAQLLFDSLMQQYFG